MTAKSVGATLYPDRILIETNHQVQAGYWIVTDQISWLPGEASNEELGKVVKKHLALSRIGLAVPNKEGFKQLQKQNAKATGIKTRKAKLTNARFVSIDGDSTGILISPSAKDAKGFAFTEGAIACAANCTDEALGRTVREGWSQCK